VIKRLYRVTAIAAAVLIVLLMMYPELFFVAYLVAAWANAIGLTRGLGRRGTRWGGWRGLDGRGYY